MKRTFAVALLVILVLPGAWTGPLVAQVPNPAGAAAQVPGPEPVDRFPWNDRDDRAGRQPPGINELQHQLASLTDAILSLPFAAALGAALAFRPRRRGTPRRQAPVIQTQIILAVVGALVMLVVGQSIARAFGIVGAASLIRYRAKVDDPKDAGVMLAALGIGLASGVGLYALAAFSTLFILILLGFIESFEPTASRVFTLKVTAKDPAKLRPLIEDLLKKYRFAYELRSSSDDEVAYDVTVPLERRTERLPDLILRLDPENAHSVDWEEKANKKKK